jgi:lipoprotein NlpD
VRAAAAGTVVYSGNGLIGYGELVIVKHSPAWLSAYGHNRKRLVKEGDKVAAGQVIAEMGSSSASRDSLHFEIRRNGKPVDPLGLLPRR